MTSSLSVTNLKGNIFGRIIYFFKRYRYLDTIEKAKANMAENCVIPTGRNGSNVGWS